MEVESEGSGEPQTGAPIAGKPPEHLGRKPTFKEKVLGTKQIHETEEFVNLVKTGIMRMEFVEDNTSFPMFSIEPSTYREICKPWEDCLVVKLLGKSIGYGALCDKLRTMWKLSGGYEVRDVHHGYFLVKFDNAEDKGRAISGAPWLIYDHYLAVKPWTPDFVAANSRISTTLVWIRIPGLGFQFYNKNILLTLASAVGTPIKVDLNTHDMQRGKYARICVEIDLTKPVLGVVGLEGTWYNIEYEGLHLLCRRCGCYGHLARNCTTPQREENTSPMAAQATNAAAHLQGDAADTSTLRVAVDKGLGAVGQSQMAAEETLDAIGQTAMDTSATPAVTPAAIPAKPAIKCPEHAHGEWLVVEKRKKKLNGNLNVNQKKSAEIKSNFMSASNKGIKQSTGEPIKGTKKGMKSKTAGDKSGTEKIPLLVPLQFTTGSTVHDGNNSHATIVQRKKRMRKESTLNYVATPTVESHSTLTMSAGGTPIFMAADGTRSTVPLVAKGGNRYQMLSQEEDQQEKQPLRKDTMTGPTPFDPGEVKGVRNGP
ncbi:uncharacterized protein LOC130713325 [Lotus japonicus]|uniref:uncharacterized protein LOC130713325 n=1 Tax=Lotus japonicus TaxID=34305 RepID=UPI002583AA54|nr:uncharacterized protein LOC130713325 [Lotus japonicus]